jgi:hypothetical protein
MLQMMIASITYATMRSCTGRGVLSMSNTA